MNPYSNRGKSSKATELEVKQNAAPAIKTTTATTSAKSLESHHASTNKQVDVNTSFSQAFGQQQLGTNQEQTAAIASNGTSRVIHKSIGTSSSSVSNLQSNNENTTILDPTALIQPHILLVSTRQRGNGLLRLIRNVPFTYAKIVPDYIFGPNRCALFLSFKYHNLNPNYIHRRIAELKNDFDLRVLLCLVDVDDNASILLHLNKTCVVNNLTLTLAWSEQEAARYLETFKAFEGKDASSIQKKKELSYSEQMTDVLGCVRSVNKTDSSQLISQFGNFKSLATASINELQSCPGIGEKKVRRLYDAFTKPFSSSLAKKRKEERERLDSIQKDISTVEDEEYEEESFEEYEHGSDHSSKQEKPLPM